MEKHEKIEFLEEYGSLINDEYGEALMSLANFYYNLDYIIDNDSKFLREFEEFVDRTIQYLKDNTNIVEEEKTKTTTYFSREVIFLDE